MTISVRDLLFRFRVAPSSLAEEYNAESGKVWIFGILRCKNFVAKWNEITTNYSHLSRVRKFPFVVTVDLKFDTHLKLVTELQSP